MEQVICSGCDSPLMEGDQFCGRCGTPAAPVMRPAPWPDPAREQREAPDRRNGWSESVGGTHAPAAQAPFFEHEPRRPPGPLGNATRYLCAAAYLDRGFANRVIGDLVATRRAVAPSVNVEVGSVIRHCLRARKNILIRDIVLFVIVLIGLLTSPLVTTDFLLIVLLLGALIPNARRKRRGLVAWVLYSAGVAAVGLLVIGVSSVLVLSLFATALSSFGSALFSGSSAGTAALSGALSDAVKIAAAFVVLLALTWGTQYAYTRATFRTLIAHLRLGARPPRPASREAEARIEAVEGAQWGNITLYGGEDPFIGAGWVLDEQWSIAIKLEPKAGARQGLQALAAGADGYVPIDPVELHGRIAERMRRLNDPSLPVNERISALTVSDRIVGSGTLRWDSPLVDRPMSMPYSHASRPAIEALIRHPQAGLRYYQQISVSDEGPPVTSNGEQVIEGADLGVVVSAFVYAAVEGRMFYLQFVLTALPPIGSDYREIDLLPGETSSGFAARVFWHSLKNLPGAVVYSPAGLYSAFRLQRRERRWKKMPLSTDGSVAGDLGALVSVRELGSAPDFGTYIRQLDVKKYKSIIERMLLETVQDFLADSGVDTSAFEGSAISIINGDVIRDVSVGGNVQNIGSGGVRNRSRARSGGS